ncbi:MAG: hypothetical protein QOE72_1681 [Chloroflexota bacterium]|nr:hypothetical protein [Chloroflexota bacterium]
MSGPPYDPPGARLTVYLPQRMAERIDQESRRLNYAYGRVSRSRLVSALVDAGFAHLGEVETALRDGTDGRLRSGRHRADSVGGGTAPWRVVDNF